MHTHTAEHTADRGKQKRNWKCLISYQSERLCVFFNRSCSSFEALGMQCASWLKRLYNFWDGYENFASHSAENFWKTKEIRTKVVFIVIFRFDSPENHIYPTQIWFSSDKNEKLTGMHRMMNQRLAKRQQMNRTIANSFRCQRNQLCWLMRCEEVKHQ